MIKALALFLLIYVGLMVGFTYWYDHPRFSVGDCIRQEDDFFRPIVYQIVAVGKKHYVMTPGYMKDMKFQQQYFHTVNRDYYKVQCQ